jgi:hypothetical protein
LLCSQFLFILHRKINGIFATCGLKLIDNIEIWANIAGIITSIFIDWLIDRINTINRITCALISLVVVSLCYFTAVTILISAVNKGYYIHKLVFASLYIVYNMSLSPIYCLCYYLVYEITYPIHSSISIGLMIGSSMLSSLAMSYLMDLIQKGVMIHLIAIGLVLIALVFIIIMKGKI